jgi:hypothetical protein
VSICYANELLPQVVSNIPAISLVPSPDAYNIPFDPPPRPNARLLRPPPAEITRPQSYWPLSVFSCVFCFFSGGLAGCYFSNEVGALLVSLATPLAQAEVSTHNPHIIMTTCFLLAISIVRMHGVVPLDTGGSGTSRRMCRHQTPPPGRAKVWLARL